MSQLQGTETYWEFLGQCAECGHCTAACPSLTQAGMTLGQIARGLIAADDASEDAQDLAMNIYANEQLTQAVRGCYFCTSCEQVCFADNDVAKLIYHARTDFQNLGLIPREAWSSVQVDQEWDIFTAYRAIYGIGYPDLTRHLDTEEAAGQHDCQVAFFPGCSLAAYGPELTREVFATVEELGGKTTMIDHCCGSPLKSAGFYDRADALLGRIADEIAASGARTVVCVCPGCCNAVRDTVAAHGVKAQVVTLASFLNQHGFTPKRDLSGVDVALSKSCQDRDGAYLAETRQLLGLPDDTPAIFRGCCGAGGAVSAFDPNQQVAQVDRKLQYVADGQTVVTMCPTCTYTYAFQLMSEPRPITNKNYLELVFENQFDWDVVFYQLNAMWSGEYGPWLAQVFA
ncbi:MAG: (Fe-S)-binding protein [Coriobacteriales bacterium]|nr:(Fe-S)-binding protein [Coriobacteriales bacterium]